MTKRLASDALLCLALAALSLAITGLRVGVNNNLFHVPLVLDFASYPEFAHDPFYASLGAYASIVWPPLRLLATESNVDALFRVAGWLSRAGAFGGMLLFVRVNGLKSLPGAALALAVVAVTPWFRGYSVVGEHGLFIDYFTQSELTWGLVFGALALVQLGRTTAAGAMTGIAFSVNAFVGAWLALAAAAEAWYGTRKRDSRRALPAAAAFLVCAAPVLAWVAFSQRGVSTPFSYIDYIRRYYPVHFLIEAASPDGLAKLTMLFACGLLAARSLPAHRSGTGAQIAIAALFIVGIPLPYLLNSRWVFNLHLLRVDGLEQALAVLLCALVGVRMLTGASAAQRLLGVAILATLANLQRHTLDLAVIAAALVAGLSHEHRPSRTPAAAALALFALVTGYQLLHAGASLAAVSRIFVIVLACAVALAPRRRVAASGLAGLLCALVGTSAAARGIETRRDAAQRHESWNEMTRWIRASALHGVFLVPLDREGDTFQLAARRRSWVDWKQGAAVMWAPYLHDRWMTRYSAVTALRAPAQLLEYARANAIPYLLMRSDSGRCPSPSRLLKATAQHVLCEVTADR